LLVLLVLVGSGWEVWEVGVEIAHHVDIALWGTRGRFVAARGHGLFITFGIAEVGEDGGVRLKVGAGVSGIAATGWIECFEN
jgi:hypothetical protein